ncbi:G-type lectin S-receptor-like serine/threonine-protein kinase RKS1 [Populus alba x Populus x berolinensis]|uniref:G-type lectin S-receptor-like serine/threonine-protein kinase RKS1 n=1 Tax=Populus alba x Populus x berolinensis TaxID=444605 RepID=A0AAD6M4N1_9ROSI|nr:G-type lectin S-receptor-like serine/threonine-protein kinase RKS1 [Populus alba x Populus x berolinensis]
METSVSNRDGNRNVSVWPANVPGEEADTSVAQLLDSGNFVLVQESGNILWQSFDYPTHYVLPGMKLGLDLKTGLDRFLTSWRSADDPYSYRVNPSGSPQIFLYKGEKRDLLRQSKCDSYGWCGPYSTCEPTDAYKFECSCLPGFEPRNPSDWLLRNGSTGCVRKRLESSSVCRNGEGFLKVEIVFLPDNSAAVWLDMDMRHADCERECKRNCSCSAYASVDIPDKRHWLFDMVWGVSGCTENARKSNEYIAEEIPAILIPTVSSALLVISIVAYFWRKRRGNKGTWVANELRRSSSDQDLPCFKLSTISAATNNFSPDNKLGQGGFGSVYKGELPDGEKIAVKRLSKNSRQGIEEITNQIKMKQESCSWIGAKGLTLLLVSLVDSRLRIIHRDLKCSNILLDAEMNPKISDFGFARIFKSDQILDNTKRVVGTYGYMSPEYAVFGKFSLKSDVFSFGVMLLEIVSGKKNNKFNPQNPAQTLIGLVWGLWKEDRALEIVDSSLQVLYHPQEALKCIKIGLLCVQEDAMERPSMLAVVFMFNSSETTIPSPKQPAFTFREPCISPCVAVSGCLNVTMTDIEGR